MDSGVQAAQVHIRRNDERHLLKEGVPGGDCRWLIFVLQGGPGQPGPVVGLGHDLKLHRPGIIAGQKVDRHLQALIRASVGDEFGVGLSVGLQFGQDVLVTLPSEDESPLRV